MDYKTILVHLDAGARRSERLEIALALADRYDAHLVGSYEEFYMERLHARYAVEKGRFRGCC